MKIISIVTVVLTLVISTSAEARHRHHRASYSTAHQDCNVLWPCEGVVVSPRGLMVVRAMGGFGTAKKVYRHRVANVEPTHRIRHRRHRDPIPTHTNVAQILPHPDGCPRRAFCGCGAAVKVFGRPVRDLWLASNWYRFPRAALAVGMVAVRRHHVFVVEAVLGNGTVMAYDANSGRHMTRRHIRSIAGYTIVNPHGSRYASAA